MDQSDKFKYLIQSSAKGSYARGAIEIFLPISKIYTKGIQSMTSRFGQNGTLIEVCINELLKIVLKNAITSNFPLLCYLYNLEQHIQVLNIRGNS